MQLGSNDTRPASLWPPGVALNFAQKTVHKQVLEGAWGLAFLHDLSALSAPPQHQHDLRGCSGNVKLEPGAVVCRVARSFVRFGSFQLPASRGGGDLPLVRALADHVIARHFPHLLGATGWGARAALCKLCTALHPTTYDFLRGSSGCAHDCCRSPCTFCMPDANSLCADGGSCAAACWRSDRSSLGCSNMHDA